MRKKRVRPVRALFSVGAESGVEESLSSILQRDRILSSFSIGMQKRDGRQTDRLKRVSCYPFPLPPFASLECAKKRRDIAREAHLAPQLLQ